jgi:hypothetical protein
LCSLNGDPVAAPEEEVLAVPAQVQNVRMQGYLALRLGAAHSPTT